MDSTGKEEERAPRSNGDLAVDAAKVDVFVAPAVLGHRYVRSRDTSHVVERPERLRASLLGLAALVGRTHQATDAKTQTDAEPASELNSIMEQLASLSVDPKNTSQRALSQSADPIRVLLSHARIPLLDPNQGMVAIHASDEDRETVATADAIAEPPAFSTYSRTNADGTIKANQRAWPGAAVSHLSLLDTLCHLAPSQPPPARIHSRSQRAKVKTEQGSEDRNQAPESQPTPSVIQPDGSYASEVPPSWPQGDLYLCGPEEAQRQVVKQEESADTAGSKLPQQLALDEEGKAPLGEFNVEPVSHVQQSSESSSKTQPVAESFLHSGSLGAIEASLGACCAALRSVVGATRPSISLSDDDQVQRVDLDNLQVRKVSADKEKASSSTNADSGKSAKRAFVLARPPGHHCTSNQPSGFCWVNNVAVLAAEAYAQYGIDRVAILDFDLHHGDGTQSIVWQINARTEAADAQRLAKIDAWLAQRDAQLRHVRSPPRQQKDKSIATEPVEQPDWDQIAGRRGQKVFYGSLHDIESYPCELGDKQKVTDASVCIDGAHGQWICNVHLCSHHNDRQRFIEAYDSHYTRLLDKAKRFFLETDASEDRSLVIISAGFDACVYEHQGMQRHGKSVPTEFYNRFTRDAIDRLAEPFCLGRCISVLEGGYSDRALITGVAAHLVGLAGLPYDEGDIVCQTSTLSQLDRVSKMAAASLADGDDVASTTVTTRKRQELSPRDPTWLKYTLEAFERLQQCCGKVRRPITLVQQSPPEKVGPWRSPRSGKNPTSVAHSPAKEVADG